MKADSFAWDYVNIKHISRHNVTPDETEEAFTNEVAIFFRSHSGRYIALSQTEAGRYLTLVFEKKDNGIIRIITAFYMDAKTKRRYRHERRV